jgi:hypothetical protein
MVQCIGMQNPKPKPTAEELADLNIRYDRLCRTASSEAFLLSDEDGLLGRLDVHFGANGVVHGCLVLEQDLSQGEIEALVDQIDEDVVWTADQPREDFAVTVYRGTEVAVLSDEDDADDDASDAEENG